MIALLVLLPETVAAVRTPRRDRTQISLNLAYGSAMASIGLTIPTIAVAMIWIDGPLDLGLEPTQMVLLAMSVIVSILTVVPGRAKSLQGGLHLALLAAFLFVSRPALAGRRWAPQTRSAQALIAVARWASARPRRPRASGPLRRLGPISRPICADSA